MCCERISRAASNPVARAAKVIPGYNPENLEIIPGGVVYRNKVIIENEMPIPVMAIIGAGQAIQSGIKASNIAKAESGRNVTAPRTKLGKLIGGVTGRTQASEISSNMRTASSTGPVSPAVQKTLSREGIPVSGGIRFGEPTRNPNFLIAAIAVIGGVFALSKYFGTKKRRR